MSAELPSRRHVLVAGVALLVAGCSNGRSRTSASSRTPGGRPTSLPRRQEYQTLASETMPDLKAAAARFVQDIGSYANSEEYDRVLGDALRTAGTPEAADRQIRDAVGPLRRPGAAVTNIIYPQFGGLAPLSAEATYASVMVVFRQDHLTPDGENSTVTRVADVRLRREAQDWRVEGLASLGGDPVPTPVTLSEPTRRLLANPNVQLPDPARWDILAGRVDPRVIDLLAALGDRAAYAVTVIRSGHPYEVIDGRSKPPVSAHSLGRAVDIWSFNGQPVTEQSAGRAGPAVDIARRLLAERATRQIGLPRGWDFDRGGSRIFTNEVHDDHMHLAF